jgi:hypothetical protein
VSTVTDAPAACSYELDNEFRIISVDPAWTQFAVANGAPDLVPPAPYGRSVWTYLSDSTTAHLWIAVFQKVIKTGTPIAVPIRCDAPGVRRYLDLLVSPRPICGVRVTSTVARLEPRADEPLLDADVPRTSELLKMCSWCKRIRLPAGWMDIEAAARVNGIFERGGLPEISHGMCPKCFAEVAALIEDR